MIENPYPIYGPPGPLYDAHDALQQASRTRSPFGGTGEWDGAPPPTYVADLGTPLDELPYPSPHPPLSGAYGGFPVEYPDLGTAQTRDPKLWYPVVPPRADLPEGRPRELLPEERGPLSVENFLARNPNLSAMKKERDNMLGWRRYLAAIIFAFVLFFPVLGMVTNLKTYAWVIVFIWILIGMIMVFWIEYRCRAEVWFMCLYRGIIVDFRKTNEVMQWLLHPAMFLAYLFMIICAIIVAAAGTGLTAWKRVVVGVLFGVGLSFVMFLVKAFIDLEGAPRLLTVNMTLFYFCNQHLLRAKGFKMIHYTQLAQYFKANKSGMDSFSWNHLFAMSEEPLGTKAPFFWGYEANRLLRKVKDLDR